MQAVQAVVKMFRLVGEDKEYGVIKIGAVFPFSERAQGRIPFFFSCCFELAFLLSDLSFFIVLDTWIKQILFNFLSLVGSIVRCFLEVVWGIL